MAFGLKIELGTIITLLKGNSTASRVKLSMQITATNHRLQRACVTAAYSQSGVTTIVENIAGSSHQDYQL